MFPCFDQPDLKASMRLATVSPEKWTVVSNDNVEDLQTAKEPMLARMRTLRFPEFLLKLMTGPYAFRLFHPTEEISTYLYAFVVGPYKEYVAKVAKGLPPMRILVRQAMAKYMDKLADRIFQTTAIGIGFYTEFFNSPLPYQKYDQIFTPDFKFNNMENVGAVMLNEKYIRKDSLTKLDRQLLAEAILHSMSHMWFGNLVTLRWWNDLWLNESFAVFMSTLALSKAKGLEEFHLEAWTVFHKNLVQAYTEDQERTTHPITSPVNNTEEAEFLFDSITYWKGASVLKQLYYFLGEEVFRGGIQAYFNKFKGKNTELNDFIGCMKSALSSHKKEEDLDYWMDLWLTKKGVSQLKPEVKFFNNLITDFNVIQTASTYGDNVCRMHRLDIALYDESFTETIIPSVYVAPQPSCSIKTVMGFPKPYAVLLNVNEYTYAKVQLDETSLAAFQQCMMLIQNELTKTLIWQSVWDMVRDGLFPASAFLKFVATQVVQENGVHIFGLALDYAVTTIREYVPDKFKVEEAARLFDTITGKIMSDKGIDNKRHLVKYAIKFAYTSKSREQLLNWMNEPDSIGMHIPAQQRYDILKLLFRERDRSMEEKNRLLEKVLENDKSELSVHTRLACAASLPDAKVKEKLWNWYKDENAKESEPMLMASMNAFWCWEQASLLDKYAKEFFGDVRTVAALRG